jgi:uncharacterized protein (TIGR02231 family)
VSERAAVAAGAPERVVATSEVGRVTFFEDRAEIGRRARVALPPGIHRVVVEGLALAADDASLVAGIAGDRARVVAARIVRRTRQAPAASAAEIEAIEADLEAARGRRVATERALARAQSEETRLRGLLAVWTQGLRRVPAGGAAEAGRWRGAHDAVDAALTRALDEVAARKLELEQARLDEQRAQGRLDLARTLVPRYEASAEIQVEVTSGGPIDIDLVYRTPGALWRPEHLARLLGGANGHELHIRTSATVWQRTGEDWRDVACRFSTARPAQAAAPPLLADDRLSLQRRQEKTVTVEAREQTIQLAGLDRGAREVDEMPGVEDGGVPLWFEAARKVTIPSDGQPFRVEIHEVRLPCAVDLVVYPERGETAHLRATATLTGDRPLLAGPVRLARDGSLVGRGRTAFVGQGEPFELGFGADDGVRVRRRVDEQRETTAVIGTQKLTRKVELYLSNLGSEARRLKVVERVPVSEIGDVEIAILDRGGATIDEPDGFARFEVELPGNATRELGLSYRIQAAAKVRLTL